MASTLHISLGQASDRGLKAENEDHFGALIPTGNALENKGLAIAIADGMSAAEGGKEASQMSIQMFLDDYFSTPESWTVKRSVTKVMSSLNGWLFSQSQRYQSAQGMVTTFSAVVIKSHTAHLFHVGDTRIYRLRGPDFEQLTQDHRLQMGSGKSYLSRALGIDRNLNIDYRTVTVEQGDIYFLSSDGIHDYLNDARIKALIVEQEPDQAATGELEFSQLCQRIIQTALDAGSDDNLTCQLFRVDSLAEASKDEVFNALARLPFPPDLQAGQIMDGYRIIRELQASSRSQVYLAEDTLAESGQPARVVIKTPSVNFEDDAAYIEMFLQEEWVGKRLNSPYLLKTCRANRKRQFLYTVLEYVKGQTLEQWMHDNPTPSLTVVRDIIEQIARGLRAMHRMEMLHQDIKPGNILINADNAIKIIDFGSTKIAGLAETESVLERSHIVGTASYSAPEYFKAEAGSNRSDIYALGVICYEMLTGKLPYGEIRPENAHRKRFRYTSARQLNPTLPGWVDDALAKAVHPYPAQRYALISEFIADLKKPNPGLAQEQQKPLIEKHPIRVWQGLALIEFILLMILLLKFKT